MNKNEIRKIILDKRNKIINKKDLSTRIVSRVINFDVYKKANVIALYKSMASEVDTTDLINNSKNKIILLPKIVNEKMEFILISNDTKYTKSNFGVMEPIGNIYMGNIDLIIIPGVSFDKERNRLGYGKGYYDKYLSDKDIYKIGICFNEQIVNLLPTTNLDIKMDMVVTEDRVY